MCPCRACVCRRPTRRSWLQFMEQTVAYTVPQMKEQIVAFHMPQMKEDGVDVVRFMRQGRVHRTQVD